MIDAAIWLGLGGPNYVRQRRARPESKGGLGQSDRFYPIQTYRWTKIPTPRTPTQEMEKLIHDSADVQLNARGLKKIENGEPDVYVGYSITLGQPKKQSATPSTTDSSSWQAGSSWSAQSPSDQTARKGTLNIDIAELMSLFSAGHSYP